jgi:hypothetical protein
MTYAGTLMLVIGVAASRLVFGDKDRRWPALVMPAMLVALTMTLTRSAWVGVSVGVGAAVRAERSAAHCADPGGRRRGLRARPGQRDRSAHVGVEPARSQHRAIASRCCRPARR